MINITNEELKKISGGCNWRRIVVLLRYLCRFI